jgi:hypothetical protein
MIRQPNNPVSNIIIVKSIFNMLIKRHIIWPITAYDRLAAGTYL